MKERKFDPGQVVATRGVAERMEEDSVFNNFCLSSLTRHLSGDWGDLDPEDQESNNQALQSGEDRIFSAYIFLNTKEKIWIITEWDHSVTTILFPSEY